MKSHKYINYQWGHPSFCNGTQTAFSAAKPTNHLNSERIIGSFFSSLVVGSLKILKTSQFFSFFLRLLLFPPRLAGIGLSSDGTLSVKVFISSSFLHLVFDLRLPDALRGRQIYRLKTRGYFIYLLLPDE